AGQPYKWWVHAANATSGIGISSSGTFTCADSQAPSVLITSPSARATLYGSTTLSASATDNVGVVGVQFKLNGANFGAEDTTPPFSISWNTINSPNGIYAIQALARDAAGNQAISTP